MTPRPAFRERRQHDPIPDFPIEPVLRELGADLVPTGFGWLRINCFAHEDRTPSAAVNHELNAYKCHSCGLSGDPLKLLQTQLGLSFKEALQMATELTGVGPSRERRSAGRRASDLLGGRS